MHDDTNRRWGRDPFRQLCGGGDGRYGWPAGRLAGAEIAAMPALGAATSRRLARRRKWKPIRQLGRVSSSPAAPHAAGNRRRRRLQTFFMAWRRQANAARGPGADCGVGAPAAIGWSHTFGQLPHAGCRPLPDERTDGPPACCSISQARVFARLGNICKGHNCSRNPAAPLWDPGPHDDSARLSSTSSAGLPRRGPLRANFLPPPGSTFQWPGPLDRFSTV